MNLTRGVCGRWERGLSNPSTANLTRLASILGVSFEWLATGNKIFSPEQINNLLDFESNSKLESTTNIQSQKLLSQIETFA